MSARRSALFRLTSNRRAAGIAVSAVVLALVGCGEEVSGPPMAPVDSIDLSPDPAHLIIGDTVQFVAVVRSPDGEPVTGVHVAWSSRDRAVVMIDSAGGAIAVGAGRTHLVAQAGEARDSAEASVSVVDRAPALGVAHTCGLTRRGEPFCWGSNLLGALGLGEFGDFYTVPQPVAGSLRFVALGAGFDHTCGLARSGRIYCWGDNGNGQLGDGTREQRALPVRVLGDRRYSSLTVGAKHGCGLSESGDAYCWGLNEDGQLGDGTATGRDAPILVSGGRHWRRLSAGRFHTCGVTVDGEAYCWGRNDLLLGLAHGAMETRVPVRADTVFGYSGIAAGNRSTCGLMSSRRAVCWGADLHGQLGTGEFEWRSDPAPVLGDVEFVRLDASFHDYVCGITPAWSLYCWGHNDLGQLGIGTATRAEPTPRAVVPDITFLAVGTGALHTCAVSPAGAMYCWGFNGSGQLGIGTQESTLVPLGVADPF